MLMWMPTHCAVSSYMTVMSILRVVILYSLTGLFHYTLRSGCVNCSFIYGAQQNREIIITDATKRIRHDGFPAEQHTVQTKDGYILTLHRIPYKGVPLYRNNKIPVVLLLGGIYASSDVWLLNGIENSLPYILSRNGFDVWLGNNRGNIYSRQNIWYNDTQREFWSFSWHEMSVYDLPAMIDHILGQTGEQKLHFVSISQGGTTFVVLNSMMPQYNAVFKMAALLAPVTYVSHSQASLAKVFGPVLGTRNYISKMLEGVEMVSTNKYIKKLLSLTCLADEPARICVSRLWPAFGYNTNMLNMTLLPDLLANFPVGGSFKQIMHYFQGYISQKFRQYDYGAELNWLHYYQKEPPEYELEKVTAPTIIFYAQNDYIIALQDMWKFIRRLHNIQGLYQLPQKYWNHFDFICGLGVRQFIFDKILNTFQRYEQNQS